jgi:hypothetical protein
LDRFTRNYSIGLGVIAAAVLVTWAVSAWNPGAARLNEVLAADAELAAYPYSFRVVAFEDGVATLGSPRSFDVPVIRFLGVLDPDLAGKAQDDPDVVAAQDRLAYHQKRAQALVAAQPGVEQVRWALDRDWYRERGIMLKTP